MTTLAPPNHEQRSANSSWEAILWDSITRRQWHPTIENRNTFWMTVGSRIIQSRKALNWTRPELAQRAGVPYPTLAGLENGDQSSSAHLPILAATLGVDALWLSSGKSPKGSPSQQPSHSARWSPMILADAMTLLDQLDQILGRAIEPRPNPARLSIACEVVEAGGVNHREGVVVRLADRLRALEGKADGDGSGKVGGVGATDGGAHGAAPRAGAKGGRKR